MLVQARCRKSMTTSDPASVRTPEQVKAYPVGRYEDPNDPDVMHEGHTIYRAETSPRMGHRSE